MEEKGGKKELTPLFDALCCLTRKQLLWCAVALLVYIAVAYAYYLTPGMVMKRRSARLYRRYMDFTQGHSRRHTADVTGNWVGEAVCVEMCADDDSVCDSVPCPASINLSTDATGPYTDARQIDVEHTALRGGYDHVDTRSGFRGSFYGTYGKIAFYAVGDVMIGIVYTPEDNKMYQLNLRRVECGGEVCETARRCRRRWSDYNTYTCDCVRGYKGEKCEVKIPEPEPEPEPDPEPEPEPEPEPDPEPPTSTDPNILRALERIPDWRTRTTLYLDSNLIEDLTPLQGLTMLTILGLSNNQITDVGPLQGLTALTALWLGENQITDVGPLQGLTALTVLGLSNNQITDVGPLQGLTRLTYLDLRSNQITDFTPLDALRAAGCAIVT